MSGIWFGVAAAHQSGTRETQNVRTPRTNPLPVAFNGERSFPFLLRVNSHVLQQLMRRFRDRAIHHRNRWVAEPHSMHFRLVAVAGVCFIVGVLFSSKASMQAAEGAG